MDIRYKKADLNDIDRISEFVDFWGRGYGVKDKIPGTGKDFFVPKGRQERYITKYNTVIALKNNKVIGWAVVTDKGVLIHLLVAGTFRGNGIGRELITRTEPKVIRSKSDQKAGDPIKFYEKEGFVKLQQKREGKHKNIDIVGKKIDVQKKQIILRDISEKTCNGRIKQSKPTKGSKHKTLEMLKKRLTQQ